jgi:hypothetical protein
VGTATIQSAENKRGDQDAALGVWVVEQQEVSVVEISESQRVIVGVDGGGGPPYWEHASVVRRLRQQATDILISSSTFHATW